MVFSLDGEGSWSKNIPNTALIDPNLLETETLKLPIPHSGWQGMEQDSVKALDLRHQLISLGQLLLVPASNNNR